MNLCTAVSALMYLMIHAVDAGGSSQLKLTESKALKWKEFDVAMAKSKARRQSLDAKRSFHASLLSKARPYDEHDPKKPAFMYRSLMNDDDAYDGYGFNVSDYSIKYTKCAAIETWNDEIAQNNNYYGVTSHQKFIMFRLCPTSSCSNNRQYGCSSNFGEYVVLLEDYIESLLENAEERENNYCELCEKCFKDDNNGYGVRRLDAMENEGEAENEDQGPDEDEADNGDEVDNNEEADNDDGNADNNDNELWFCSNFYNACSNWENDCVEKEYNRDYYDDQWEPPEEVNYKEFADCTKVDIQSADNYGNDNNIELYIGPRCGSDGTTIELDVYFDEFCSDYAGDEYSPSDLIQNFNKNGLSQYISTDCVSCNAANSQNEFNMDQYKDGGNNQYEDNVEYEVLEMCQQLFETAGKCHRSMSSDKDSYMSSQQYENESKVCNFIEEIIKGTYDENGTIKVSIAAKAKEFVKSLHTEEVTDGQIFGLVFSLLACIFLGVYAAQLRNYLSGEMALKKKYYYGGNMSPGRGAGAPLV